MEESIVQSILNGCLVDPREVFHGWVILVDNKVFRTYNGKFLFKSRRAATSAFYNELAWKARRCVLDYIENNNLTSYTIGGHPIIIPGTNYWDINLNGVYREFKETIKSRIEIKEI